MYVRMPNPTEIGRARDPLREVANEHEEMARWMSYLDDALDDLARLEGWTRVRIVELFLSQSLSRHFGFEERAVFPALLDLEPSDELRAVVDELVVEHELLAAEVRTFTSLTRRYDLPPPPHLRAAIESQGRALGAALLEHAAKEQRVVAPVLKRRRVDLPMRIDFEPLPW